MFIKANKELVLVLFHKSGSSSITKILNEGWSEIDSKTALTFPTRVAFMREPHERAESAFNMFVYEGESQHNIASFDEFIFDICKDPKNDPHVMSQSEQCYHNSFDAAIFVPTRIIKWDFEELSSLLGQSIPLINEGVGKRPKWGKKARERFDREYHLDLLFWESAIVK